MSNRFKIYIIIKLYIFCMNAKNFFTTFYIRTFNRNLSVKTTRTKQCRIKNICTVCCSKNNQAFFIFKTVHFYQKLVQGLFTFIISTTKTIYTAFSQSIDFIYKHDTRCFFTSLFKQITNTAGSNTNKHFNKV